jgi:ABC-2 type transport system ATP-binding protein
MTNPRSGPGETLLELCGVSKFYGGFKAVDDLGFSLAAGTITGFLGPNGAGKTTTLRMILGILQPDRGTITVLGRPSALEARHRIGYLPEERGLYKKMKTRAVIAYFAALKGMPRRAAMRRAIELLERHGLKDFAGKPTDALSKGMGQKVQLLAAIAHDPELVVLDEPFSGLDPVNQQVIEEIIRDAARRRSAVLFSTHVMEHAERLCDRIILLAKGRKVFDGTVAEAKRILPRRARVEAEGDVASLAGAAGILSVVRVGPSGGARAGGEPALWDLELREEADLQAVLQGCLDRGIRPRSFNQCEPTLHEIFLRLVGPGAEETGFR